MVCRQLRHVLVGVYLFGLVNSSVFAASSRWGAVSERFCQRVGRPVRQTIERLSCAAERRLGKRWGRSAVKAGLTTSAVLIGCGGIWLAMRMRANLHVSPPPSHRTPPPSDEDSSQSGNTDSSSSDDSRDADTDTKRPGPQDAGGGSSSPSEPPPSSRHTATSADAEPQAESEPSVSEDDNETTDDDASVPDDDSVRAEEDGEQEETASPCAPGSDHSDDEPVLLDHTVAHEVGRQRTNRSQGWERRAAVRAAAAEESYERGTLVGEEEYQWGRMMADASLAHHHIKMADIDRQFSTTRASRSVPAPCAPHYARHNSTKKAQSVPAPRPAMPARPIRRQATDWTRGAAWLRASQLKVAPTELTFFEQQLQVVLMAQSHGQIKKAYRAFVLHHHPDRTTKLSAEEQKRRTDIFKRVTAVQERLDAADCVHTQCPQQPNPCWPMGEARATVGANQQTTGSSYPHPRPFR